MQWLIIAELFKRKNTNLKGELEEQKEKINIQEETTPKNAIVQRSVAKENNRDLPKGAKKS
jgi:hypothetical protein